MSGVQDSRNGCTRGGWASLTSGFPGRWKLQQKVTYRQRVDLRTLEMRCMERDGVSLGLGSFGMPRKALGSPVKLGSSASLLVGCREGAGGGDSCFFATNCACRCKTQARKEAKDSHWSPRNQRPAVPRPRPSVSFLWADSGFEQGDAPVLSARVAVLLLLERTSVNLLERSFETMQQ